MKATLVKIDPLKTSYSGDYTYQRLKFELEDGSFAMTDVVASFRNYKYWKPVLEAGVGTVISNVTLKENKKIDADSPVVIVQKTLL